MEPDLAIDDKDATFSHVAFRWESDPGLWYFLCAGRTPEEFQKRVTHWIGKGIDPAIIKQYSCQLITDVTPQAAQAEPQIQAFAAPESQPQLISEELWAVLIARRPGAYETLQKYNVQYAIIKVRTSRTKLEFPVLPNVVQGEQEWQEFDTHGTRPIIVLDGTPETGFERRSLRYPNGQ